MGTMTSRRLWLSVGMLTVAALAAQIAQLGCGFPLLALQVTLQTEQAWLIGLVTGVPWLAMTLGLAQVNTLGARLGTRNTAWLGLGISVAGLAMLLSPSIWLLMLGGMAIGYGMALRWVTLETWMYALTPTPWRGRVVGMTEFLLSTGYAAGPWLVGHLTPGHIVIVAIVLVVLSLLATTPVPRHSEPVLQSSSMAGFWRDARLTLRVLPLSVVCVLVAGFIDMAFVGLLPHYARAMGSTPAQGLHYLFIFGIGMVCGPLPFGWLADIKSVALAAIVAAALGCIGALAMLGANVLSLWSLWLIGVSTGALFTLAFVDVALFHSRARIGVFMSTVGALYTLFATVGPALSGALMDLFGVRSLPAMVFGLLFFCLMTALRANQHKRPKPAHLVK